MQLSVVIPTRNREDRLLALLACLDRSLLPVLEVIVVDAGDIPFEPAAYASRFSHLAIRCIASEASVCIQRNKGIKAAAGPWIFICDDDIEVPEDYLLKIWEYIKQHPEAGAVSGQVLQQEQGRWIASYPLTSAKELLVKYIFQLGIWGGIDGTAGSFLVKKIKASYQHKGNHISRAGWPVIITLDDISGTVPVYGLGASVIRKEWLLSSPYDEVLDRHGIGDNYGVAIGFPGPVHVLHNAFVYHHQETTNRLLKPLQYYRRVLALDYFIRLGLTPVHVKRRWLWWSLVGNLLLFLAAGDKLMVRPALRAIAKVGWGKNPYLEARKQQRKITEPLWATDL